LEPILARKNKFQLIELNLIRTKIPASVSQRLLEVLTAQNSLRKLALVDANLSKVPT